MTSAQFVNFIDQTNDIFYFNNLENVKSVYHYSVPNTKLAYPEPFIASASFMHSDLWFVHILIYQYWLWFVFIFIIVFFFITFLATIRWCNMRIRPRRETRGVSRSKCGDLITATVPVSWATSIIVNESTDAIDYYDGFGTTELVVGIRAYQWGWEYYYPKDIDLSYNIKPNYSVFLGNSLKYNRSSDVNLHTTNVWKFYQNKNFDHVVTPAHLLVIPSDNNKILNFLNFNDIGSNTIYESNAFKRIRMFSKTYTANLLNFIPNNYASKYKEISSYYVNRSSYYDSYLYGVKRQHNYLNKLSFLNTGSTFLDINSCQKLLFINYQNNTNLKSSVALYNTFSFFNKFSNSSLNFRSLSLSSLFKGYFNSLETSAASNLFSYTNFAFLLNDDSDKKKINNPLLSVFDQKFYESNALFAKNSVNQIGNSNNDFVVTTDSSNVSNFFENENKSYKAHLLFSPNQSVAATNRSVRNFVVSNRTQTPLNYTSDLNEVNADVRNSNSKAFANTSNYFKKLNSLNLDSTVSSKILSNRITADYPYAPVSSNNSGANVLNYDNHKLTFVDNTPSVLQGKEELIPVSISSIYWNFSWLNSSSDWRWSNSRINNSLNSAFYLPLFSFYYDYDFRNWQALELLEDCFWESTYSIYNHDEYLTLSKDFYANEYADKFINYFNNLNRLLGKAKTSIILPTHAKDYTRDSFYSNFFFLEEASVNPTNLSLNDFSIFPINTFFSNLDENYDVFKNTNHLFNTSGKFSLNTAFFKTFHSHFYVLDSFRSDFDEFSWHVDENEASTSRATTLSAVSRLNYPIETSLLEENDLITNDENSRFTNHVNLRNTAKSSIVTHNAIQKIFKTRFDENRSHTKLHDLSYFHNKQPFLSSERTPYETILKKNKENFYSVNFYKNNFKSFFNSFYDVNTSINFYFFDFPFLLALKSDSSRYLWFDWFAKWGYYEVQPSSSSRYAIHGMPYFSKNFEFSTNNGETLNETENYLTRLAKARRNYLPNWTYTPYFYAKNNVWYKSNLTRDLVNRNADFEHNASSTLFVLKDAEWYWKSPSNPSTKSKLFLPSNSNISSFTRAASRSQNPISSYYYSVSSLIDILTKREYLYRDLLASHGKIISLPSALTNGPKNPLLREIKACFEFIDPIIAVNEYSRDLYFYSLNFFNQMFFKTSFTNSFTEYGNYVINLLFNYTNKNIFVENSELYKNQYRPMRKGITNMIRLHATGAMALPIEIRLQVLASSKDVIHSWAIPSAGIKIDCVPGYSSHRVMIFLVSGIFWGQCMEICGRYHHWMPIVVYFMKRDLFFLWCTHFIFLSGANNAWTINDKQYADYVRLASFDKSGWIAELANS